MIAAAARALPRPAAVIVGEPTGMRLATQHKGVAALSTRVAGVEAHSSLTHQGVSAVMLAAELITHLGEISRRLALCPVDLGSVFEPPFTTLSVNRIEGGTATNVLAAVCEFAWDIRVLPGETPTSIIGELSTFADQRLAELSSEGKPCTIETQLQADVPPLKAQAEGPAASLVRAVSDGPGEPLCLPFGSEGGLFQRAGWSTVICGPGSIEQAHKPNEFIERSQLLECERLLERAVTRQCH